MIKLQSLPLNHFLDLKSKLRSIPNSLSSWKTKSSIYFKPRMFHLE